MLDQWTQLILPFINFWLPVVDVAVQCRMIYMHCHAYKASRLCQLNSFRQCVRVNERGGVRKRRSNYSSIFHLKKIKSWARWLNGKTLINSHAVVTKKFNFLIQFLCVIISSNLQNIFPSMSPSFSVDISTPWRWW